MSWSYLLETDTLTREQLRKYNVSELQEILTQLGLDSTGKKHELVDRLYQFWFEIQSPSSTHRTSANGKIMASCCIKFQLPQIDDILLFRSKLESYGQINGLLLDPELNSCYVSYKTLKAAQTFFDECQKNEFQNQEFVTEADFENRTKELQMLPKECQLHNYINNRFKKTNTKPRIFWCPGPNCEEI